MKKRHIPLLSIIALFLIGCLLQGFTIVKKAKEVTPSNFRTVMESEGSYFTDTANAPFKFLVSDFPALQLDPRHEDRLIIEGYEGARNLIDTYVSGDTLYVLHNPSQYKRVSEGKINGEWTLLARVGSIGLKGIQLFGQGQINHEARPTGADLDGTPVYNEATLQQYKTHFDSLHLVFNDATKAKLFLEANTIIVESNLSKSFSSSSSFNGGPGNVTNATITLSGEANKLIVRNPKSTLQLWAPLSLDTLIVEENIGSKSTGQIIANPTKYLSTRLHGNLDVVYNGYVKNTVISSTGYGRTINKNMPFFDARENNSSQNSVREAVKVAQDIASKQASTVYQEITPDSILQLLENGERLLIARKAIIKDINGNVVHPDSITKDLSRQYGNRFFADTNGKFQEFMLRERLPIDDKIDSLFEEQNERFRPIIPVFTNCNHTSVYWSELEKQINDTDRDKIYYNASLVINILNKCDNSLSSITMDQGQLILSTLSKASPKFSKEVIEQLRFLSSKNIISSDELMQVLERVETYDNRFTKDSK